MTSRRQWLSKQLTLRLRTRRAMHAARRHARRALERAGQAPRLDEETAAVTTGLRTASLEQVAAQSVAS